VLSGHEVRHVDEWLAIDGVPAQQHDKHEQLWSSVASLVAGGIILTCVFLDKEQGHKTTLPTFLKARSDELSVEFNLLSSEEKGALLTDFLQAKAERDATKKPSNVAISKAIEAKVHKITSIVCTPLSSWQSTELL
jgi:hypothetical protein